MASPSFIFVPALCLLGIITSIEDCRFGKIRNIWIICGLLFGVICYAVTAPFEKYLFDIVVINLSLSIIMGYLLWHFNIWSAGDAKLFFVYTLLLPPQLNGRTH